MCRFSALLLLLLWLLPVACASAAEPGKYGLGREATPQEIAGWDISVRPDGANLPAASGSVAKGEQLYEQKCAMCHGSFGESNDYHVLAGGKGTLATPEPLPTVGSKWQFATTLFDYIRRAMPLNAPESLSSEEVYSLTAYVLFLNDILPENATLDKQSLPLVKMPNAAGFSTDHGFMRVDGKPDTHNTACMRDCVVSVAIKSEFPRASDGQVAAVLSAPVPQTPAAPKAKNIAAITAFDLAKKSGCTGCHALAGKLVGPAFRDVAARYKGDAGAEAKLIAKVKQGGSGIWGAIPMPPQAAAGDTTIKILVEWILGGAATQ
jgi:S-disulfanyl-L-cysteine oxidoreductase SoxD